MGRPKNLRSFGGLRTTISGGVAGGTPAATVGVSRAVSSVVERLVYTERVGGSKPSPPMSIFDFRLRDRSGQILRCGECGGLLLIKNSHCLLQLVNVKRFGHHHIDI